MTPSSLAIAYLDPTALIPIVFDTAAATAGELQEAIYEYRK